MMKKIYYILIPVLLFFISSCSNNITQPEETSNGATFYFEHSKNPEPFPFFNLNKLNTPNGLKKIQAFDELKILCLDMTRFTTYQDFLHYWENTNQESFFNEMDFDSTKDDWDNIVLAFKKYTGDAFEVVGEYTFGIKDNVAKGTVFLNPGLNFFLYALRSGGKTEYFEGTYSMISADSTNKVRLYYYPEFNYPPTTPTNPHPGHGATGVYRTGMHLGWTCFDDDYDVLYYDVYFGTTTTPQLVSSAQTSTTWQIPTTLLPMTTYYWYVVADDHHGHRVTSPTFTFTTGN